METLFVLVAIIVAFAVLCGIGWGFAYHYRVQAIQMETALEEAGDISMRVVRVRVAPGEFLCVLWDAPPDTQRFVRQKIAELLVIDKNRVIMLPRDVELATIASDDRRASFNDMETK